MKFKLILSIIVCRLLVCAGKLLGKKGSSTPGRIAMKICPDILKILSKKVHKGIICTLGTNGKTTTNNMINSVILSTGAKTVCNSVGANMLYGIVTAFADSANILGNINADWAVIEIDEATAKKAFDHFTPDYIVLTNLFRDQLDRYGEIELTSDHIKKAIEKAPEATLILNADDPLCNYFSYIFDNKTVCFGVNEQTLEQTDEAKDGRFCKICGSELEYEYYHYSQLGKYKCPGCDFIRKEPDYYASDVKCDGKLNFIFNNKFEIHTNTYGFYNVYNVLAAVSVAETLNLYIANYTNVFREYETQTGRMEEFNFIKPVILNLAKNPAGFNQAITAIQNDKRKKAVLIGVNDYESDGMDVSWLYDVEFEKLENLCGYAVSGRRKYDVALRLYYADVCKKPEVFSDPSDGAMALLRTEAEVVYVLVNYTMIFDTQKGLKKKLKQHKKEHGTDDVFSR